MKSLLVFTGVGFELVGLILAAVYIGEYLKVEKGWTTWGVAAPILIALSAWLLHLVWLLTRIDQTEDRSNNSQR